MEGTAPQVPIAQAPVIQETQPEVKEVPQVPSASPKKGLKLKISRHRRVSLWLIVILIGLLSLGIGGFFVYKNITGLKVEKGVVPAPSTEVQVYKGIWIPALLSENTRKVDSDMKKLKEMGMNTVFFQGAPPQAEHCLEGIPPDSKLAKKFKEIIPIHEELLISNIQTAHKNGLKVGLTMAKCLPASEKISIEAWNSKVVEYAKLAEKHEVELFAPMNEPEVLFGPSASATWGQEILPKIKEVYHGKIVWKGGAPGDMQPDARNPDPTNFSGYDYLGITLGVGSAPISLENFIENIYNSMKVIHDFAERDGVKGVIITEFYGRLPGRWEERDWTEEKEARAHEIVLEKEKGKVIGFFALDFLEMSFFGEELPGVPDSEKSSKTQEVLKKYFTEIL